MTFEDDLVVVIEDDAELASSLRVKLPLAGFRVLVAGTVAGGLTLAREWSPAVVVANVDLPHGRDILTRLGQTGVPLILLTSFQGGRVFPSRNVEVLRKPFLFHVLLEQMGSLSVAATCLSVGMVHLDVKARLVTVRKLPVPVSAKEFELLVLLMRQPLRARSSQELIGAIWTYREASLSSLTMLVTAVRRKLSVAGQPGFIRTVRGFGYGLST